jgi:hypothetical protein
VCDRRTFSETRELIAACAIVHARSKEEAT